ncbi:hypothetical protein FJU11_16695 [Pararhizobium mangrovi]|uniref:Uncharacterized protein n=2 Tax=Pararhizobium mangrovi TaxID=2590452 RepID=A0A506TXD8_9HYPH|nr:hypothetical protein FJU11_16695 [Pararhizobium mangrovi]
MNEPSASSREDFLLTIAGQKDLAEENNRLLVCLVDARAEAQSYQARAVAAEQLVEDYIKSFKKLNDRKKQLQSERETLVKTLQEDAADYRHELQRLRTVRTPIKLKVARQIGLIVIEAWRRPFSKGLVLPLTLWTFRRRLWCSKKLRSQIDQPIGIHNTR